MKTICLFFVAGLTGILSKGVDYTTPGGEAKLTFPSAHHSTSEGSKTIVSCRHNGMTYGFSFEPDSRSNLGDAVGSFSRKHDAEVTLDQPFSVNRVKGAGALLNTANTGETIYYRAIEDGKFMYELWVIQKRTALDMKAAPDFFDTFKFLK